MSTTVVDIPASTTPAPAPKPAGKAAMNAEQMVNRYVRLRDKVAEIKKQQAEVLAPYHEAMQRLEGMLLEVLQAQNAESSRTESGTFYKVTRSSATVHAWSETLDYIRANDAWELLEARVSKTAVEALMAETGQTVPGVAVRRELALNVRRS